MKKNITSIVESLIVEVSGSYFKRFLGKIRLKYLIKKLKDDVETEILNRYGDKAYYLDFDRFLIEQNVINSVIINFYQVEVLDAKTINQIVDYYLNLFLENNPNYKRYRNDFKQIIQRYFEIIFKQLNKLEDPEFQKLCKVVKELIAALNSQLQDIKQIVSESQNLLKSFVNGNFRKKEYFQVLSNSLLSKFNHQDYIDRQLMQGEESGLSLEVLLKNNKVALVGEAGYGKTYETIRIINQLCIEYLKYQLVPVYIPLLEYSGSTNSLYGLLQRKIESFCEGSNKQVIDNLLKNNQLALFFDGIDDINDDNQRMKFFAEANQLMAQYSNNFYFFTTRSNRYCNELGEEITCSLSDVPDHVIQNDLRIMGRYGDMPKTYVDLFKNPLLFKIGKSILSQEKNKDLFNRTRIFQNYFEKIYLTNKNKSKLSFHDTLVLLGKFSYENFERNSFAYFEIDKKLSNDLADVSNKREIIHSFINFGIFNILESITFTHKLFKEYCIAYYLADEFCIYQDLRLFKDLVSAEEWKEVFVFIAGSFSELDVQDKFLDFVLEHNFPLYVECVNSKNDLIETTSVFENSLEKYTERLLSEIYKTYKFIVENYFPVISNQFEPFLEQSVTQKFKIGITGSLKNNQLNYWFDIVEKEKADIKVVDSNKIAQISSEYQENIFRKTTRMVRRVINIELSGLSGDSGRKIAINLIKDNLERILSEKTLLPSNYILCEILKDSISKISWLKDCDDIFLMNEKVNNYIENVVKERPEDGSITDSNGIEFINLRKRLDHLRYLGLNYKDCIIPSRDKDYSEENALIDSFKRRMRIIESFFNFAEISYLEMVKNNFPKFYQYFSKVQDMPYQLCVSYRDNDGLPSVKYYYVACAGLVNLVKVSEKAEDKSYEETASEILESYTSLGRIPKNVSTTSLSFTSLLYSYNLRENIPLTDFVYQQIKSSLEEVFGRL